MVFYKKLSLRANTRVLGMSLLNKTVPEWEGKNKVADSGRSNHATTNSANPFFADHNIGQYTADCHNGTIIVPTALHSLACPKTLGTKNRGGHHQLFSPFQSTVNVSTASLHC